jgi:epoxyqueuosine reductase
MGYLNRHAPLKADPAALLPGARALVVATLSYHAPAPRAGGDAALRGRVARYAWGRDYHEAIEEKLARLGEWLDAATRREQGRPAAWRAFVDTSPVMEREFAVRAGLGWVGKNANLIHWEHGSWLFIAGLLVDVPLDCDAPVPAREADAAALLPARESCGTCTACIEACPTGAIVADKTVDARRCISYLTIELKAPIPPELRPGLGRWVFGCDVCQEVCPWNRAPPADGEPADAGTAFPPLAELLGLDESAFSARLGHTALARPRRRGLLRNAAIVLGNALAGGAPESPGHAEGLAALRRALGDPEPLVRGAAAWALGRARPAGADAWLRRALDAEADPGVQDELGAARAALRAEPP